MHGFPPYPMMWALSVFALLACQAPSSDEGRFDSSLPFIREPSLEPFVLVSTEGDTLRFLAENGRGDFRLTRLRSVKSGLDSTHVRLDQRSLAPKRSFQRVASEDGFPLEALVEYGAGFDGQARVTIHTDQGEQSRNLRTPDPFLDAMQLPWTFSSLTLDEPGTLAFNYIAPFERRALPARLEIGRARTLRMPYASVSAIPVRLRVSGLTERYWYSAPPGDPHLLRLQEITRGITWTRTGPAPQKGDSSP
jgi:hypothetical protein